MRRTLASLSLDLDNKWSYLKTRGDGAWESFPSYLNRLVPRVLDMLARLDLRITFFVVGQDAAIEENHSALQLIAAAGHEIANHSFAHEPWLQFYTLLELQAEIESAERAIEAATGIRPVGFRGPGFSWSLPLIRILSERGYRYDASTFPTFLGPLARAYYFMTARLTREQRQQRKALFGGFREGFRRLRPYWWQDGTRQLLEIPVTTMPLCRAPIHVSYLLYLRQFSRRASIQYFRTALGMCKLAGVEPSLLLHPLDFLGSDDEPDLGFFPAMQTPAASKLDFVAEVLETLSARYRVVPLLDYADEVSHREGVALVSCT